MEDEHLDTILATESDEFIKSSVDNLILIPSESEGIPDHMCDVPSIDNSPPVNVSEDQIEDFSESSEEFSSTDDDSFSFDNIDHVEASPPDSELDLPSNNSFSFAEKESFYFDILSFSRPPAKPPAGDTGILNIKMMGDIYDQKTFMPRIYSSIVITTYPPVLPTADPDDSLIMGNEELNTIPEKESNEFIKSSVEDHVPIPSASEDTFGSESVCILPSCDDFYPIDVPEEKAVTFANPLFNSNDDFTSRDDESLSNEDDSYDPNLDESTFLVTPLSDSNEDGYFTPSNDIELILHHDPSIPKMSVASILEGDSSSLEVKSSFELKRGLAKVTDFSSGTSMG
nr:hypothetical protein [Tanacetum cinerariifolium]